MATEREIEAEAYIAGMEHGVERGVPNPTPTLTAGDGEIVRRMVAIKRAKREAFEEAAEIRPHEPKMKSAIYRRGWIDAADAYVAAIRALAKEKPDG